MCFGGDMNKKRILFFIMMIGMMMLIFFFSSQNGDESSAMSSGVFYKLKESFNIKIDIAIIRKLAHLTEYLFLGVTTLLYVGTFKISDEKSMAKISKIRELEARTKEYKLIFDKDGKIESRHRLPSLEDKVNSFLTSLYISSSTKTPEQIVNDVLQSEQYSRASIEHPEINLLINQWQEKTKHYTYRDKIRLITIDYSQKLQGYDRKAIDNVLDFLQRRHKNHGKNNDDME